VLRIATQTDLATSVSFWFDELMINHRARGSIGNEVIENYSALE
jgi:hypothetical protein